MTIHAEVSSSLALEAIPTVVGSSRWSSCLPVSELASAAVGAVGTATASLKEALGLMDPDNKIVVDQELASLAFARSTHPIGWELAPTWDAMAGDYRAADGWIRLHTNLPHHRAAACRVLGVAPQRAQVEAALASWPKDTLEEAIHGEGGVAAALHSVEHWFAHPQGAAVRSEPLIRWQHGRRFPLQAWKPTVERPLAGLRVLDLTRVLAGPVATRTLAGLGADVLRIDPPGWEEENVAPDITVGKRCATLNLTADDDRRIFERLLQSAHLLVHGYRPGALERLGYGDDWRREHCGRLLEVSLNAYGWTGPWASRRGFDSLVQMSSGIADRGARWWKVDHPVSMPVQALDHATGYLMAAAAVRGLERRLRGHCVVSAQLSLARTAVLLLEAQCEPKLAAAPTYSDDLFDAGLEKTAWGPAKRLRSPLRVGCTLLHWTRPACRFGSADPAWSPDPRAGVRGD